jgi:hypothetical protein
VFGVRRLNLKFHQQKIVRQLLEGLRNDTHPMIHFGYGGQQISYRNGEEKEENIPTTVQDLRDLERFGVIEDTDSWSTGGTGSFRVDIAAAADAVESHFAHRLRDLVVLAIYELSGKEPAIFVDEDKIADLTGLSLKEIRYVGFNLAKEKLVMIEQLQSSEKHFHLYLTTQGWEWVVDPVEEASATTTNIGAIIGSNTGQVQAAAGSGNRLDQTIEALPPDELRQFLQAQTEAMLAAVADLSEAEAAAIRVEAAQAVEAGTKGKMEVAKEKMFSIATRVASFINKGGELIENSNKIVEATTKLGPWLHAAYLVFKASSGK